MMKWHVASLTAVAGILSWYLSGCFGTGGWPECSRDIDCNDDERCISSTCVPAGATGEACTVHKDCQVDLNCYAQYTYAHDDICQPPGLYGFPCPNGVSDCAYGYDCDGVFWPTCHKPDPPPKKSECYFNSDCPGDLVCNWGYFPNECTELQPPYGTCGHDNECLSPNHCDEAMGYCVPPAAEGDPCDPGLLFSQSPCESGLYCTDTGSSYVCQPPLGEGDSCTGALPPCAAGLSCGLAPFQSFCEPALRGEQCGLFTEDDAPYSCAIESPTLICVDVPYDHMLIQLVPCGEGLFCDTSTDPATCQTAP